jgi:hypothetical protein
MENKALAEAVVDLWNEIAEAWERINKTTLPITAHVAMFERADAHIISAKISKERKGTGGRGKPDEDEPPTSAQLNYIEDLGGDPHEPATKQEASDLIEDLLAKKQRRGRR